MTTSEQPRPITVADIPELRQRTIALSNELCARLAHEPMPVVLTALASMFATAGANEPGLREPLAHMLRQSVRVLESMEGTQDARSAFAAMRAAGFRAEALTGAAREVQVGPSTATPQ